MQNTAWIQNEHHKNQVYIQTQTKHTEQRQEKLEKADLYIQAFGIVAWLAGSILVWMLLGKFFPAVSWLWDILAVLVFVYFSLFLVWKLYMLWIY